VLKKWFGVCKYGKSKTAAPLQAKITKTRLIANYKNATHCKFTKTRLIAKFYKTATPLQIKKYKNRVSSANRGSFAKNVKKKTRLLCKLV